MSEKIEGGSFEVLSARLKAQAARLQEQTEALNEKRLNEYGRSDMALVSRLRIRTENNCLARDTVQIGDLMIFGYNVFIGLKTETRLEDVFALFRKETVFDEQDNGTHTLESVPLTDTFLNDAGFRRDFDELYRFYKNAKFLQFRHVQGKLLASFQLGERLEDIRVFRWQVEQSGERVSYIDNRGERDIALPNRFDFEWIATGREHTVVGRHPHVNVLNQLFVETIGGDLTVKIENNTETGQGIYSEPVEDKTQSIDDGDIAYADLGALILLRILPYKENRHRYLVFNKALREVKRVDAIGQSCVQLPEDHGIVFPGGYYLATGVYKQFETTAGWRYKRQFRSPNGEDCLFVFYHPERGEVSLLGYNLITRELQNPIEGQGYALASDGTLILSVQEPEPTRIHPMQVWKTPFYSDEHAAERPVTQTLLGRIGNADLVRGISELFSLVKLAAEPEPSASHYEGLSQKPGKIIDTYYWLSEMPELKGAIEELASTTELVLDEYDKVEAIRHSAIQALDKARSDQSSLLASIRPDEWETAELFAEHLQKLKNLRGHLKTLREQRYIDLGALENLDTELSSSEESLIARTIEFLADPRAFTPYHERLQTLETLVESADTHLALTEQLEAMDKLAEGIDLLSELAGSLTGADVNVQTAIIDSLSEVYTLLNQKRAKAQIKAKNLGLDEARSQFGAQLRLFSQGVSHAVAQADSPESTDAGLARLLVQLEELETRFGSYDEFLPDILAQREQLYETFEAHKQQLLDARQQRSQTLVDAGLRMLATVERRTQRFQNEDELNAFATGDPLIRRLQDSIERLRNNEAAVQADDLDSRLKSTLDQARRSLRDRSDLYEEGGAVIKLGPRHRFSVNTQELDLTLLPRENGLFFHLTGTQYYSPCQAGLESFRTYWSMTIESESEQVYRAEYLAYSLLDSLDLKLLSDEAGLMQWVQKQATSRYREGYTKGVHDHDAALILKAIAPLQVSADTLRFAPAARALAHVFWANLEKPLSVLNLPGTGSSDPGSRPHQEWPARAQSAYLLRETFGSVKTITSLQEEIALALGDFSDVENLPIGSQEIRQASNYLVESLKDSPLQFPVSRYARQLQEAFYRSLSDEQQRSFETGLKQLAGRIAARWGYTTDWLEAFIHRNELFRLMPYVAETTALINTQGRLSVIDRPADLEVTVEGLLGDHPNIDNQKLGLRLDDFHARLHTHTSVVVPAYQTYLQERQRVLDTERKRLRLHEFKPKPLTTFVRNRLISESYLPLIGDNFAKQMGTVGESRRTDSQGLLMMISPPGYGKTTLMEYVASRLGLIFMKINCPSLGHSVDSLDPANAPNATARQELEKLNLALEMGNNVLLYLDDIQHTNPEFLQKFISLCDATRRIEGVWEGQTKTYDLRGRRFAIAMAGNPYTESGELFKIPDMLANRADVYNLGDILGGMQEAFEMSYIENSLSANPILAPLANRDMADVYTFVNMAQGKSVAASELKHGYSAAEVQEIRGVLEKMFWVRDLVLKVNQQYIASAAQDDQYRTEPPFKLQGSYRNMNKLSSKVSAVMNQQELEQLIDDHYAGESQLLTTGAEENLLKLKSMRNRLTEAETTRWDAICTSFRRAQAIGGSDQDVGQKVVAMLADLVAAVSRLDRVRQSDNSGSSSMDDRLTTALDRIGSLITGMADKPIQVTPTIEIINQPLPRMGQILEAIAGTLEQGLTPLVHSMEKKLEVDLGTHHKLLKISQQLRELSQSDSESGEDSE